ncbi:hypothetical protein A3F06_04365 [candidate division TM6 bacterium RIFCSPHIGHO2_12_FULL_36_22]|nr:MAG: hypothetical protein A3F06_04365 [candidate division TM6 bacterium RIFCSPHIGHO2_12_FULL_36_22]
MVRRFGMLKYYIYLLIFLVSLNADCGSFSEEVLRLSVAQKYKINQNIEQLQIKLKSEKNTSQIAKLEKSLAMYESRLKNPTQYLRQLQQQREYRQRDDVKKRKQEYRQRDNVKKRKQEYMQEYYQRDDTKKRNREYQREYLQRDDVKKRKREYLQEYSQRDDVKKRKQEYMQEYRQRDDVKSEKESIFSPNIEEKIDSWFSLDNFQ